MNATEIGIISALIALASSIASIVSAGAANRSAKSSEASVKLTASQLRTSLERDTNRAIHQVLANASRVIELSGALDRAYVTLFALGGRNIEAAKPPHDCVITKRAEAETMRESAHECNRQDLKTLKDTELEGYVQRMEGHLAQLNRLESSLTFDLNSTAANIRLARERE